ncbi:homoserine kinase [Gordonia neofelifaecis]|uniref:Homoserine kinase n=1 Tax=Gordonia neofelifaecis NRRL B-59395 TaxID=644548 RepID=F1YFQ3_9ACTN|nr:homoserine kinase [Gordonia neofelifaecis]EGD56685.1 homoserine kinase [Gordonia neofelifaecis NRRL B-59395]
MTTHSTIGAADAELTLPEGLSVRVRVPASSANLGPGFDCLGLALSIYDEVAVTVTDGGITVAVSGEAADQVPLDERHLVARAVVRGFETAGVAVRGFHLECRNAIPHSRGLGSSAAAVVGGLAAASALVARDGRRPALDDAQMVQLSSEFEGHPDNAAASVLGSAVVTWTHGEREFFARRLDLHPAVVATVFVPEVESSTEATRGLLPDAVPRTDAVFNVSRAALGVVALTAAPECLIDATQDRLHQEYRAQALPETTRLVGSLREGGHAATVSGAGPSVLVLGTNPLGAQEAELAADLGFTMIPVEVAEGVEVVS